MKRSRRVPHRYRSPPAIYDYASYPPPSDKQIAAWREWQSGPVLVMGIRLPWYQRLWFWVTTRLGRKETEK